MGYAPSADPHFPVDGRIIFTFNDIPEGAIASAAFDDGTYAPTVVNAEANTVTVSPALLTPETRYTFALRVVRSAVEPYTLYDNPTTDGVVGPLFIDSGKIAFTTAPSELVPVSTNLYSDRSGFAYTPTDAAHFPVDRDIVITFANIPAGAVAKAVFDSGTYAPATIAGNTVTIAPTQLTTDQQYFTLDIIKSTAEPYVLYRTPAGPGIVGPLFIADNATGNPSISFTPAESELVLIGTNLYVDQGIQQPSSDSEAIFPADGVIEFTFNDLPGNAVIVADVNDGAIPVEVGRNGNTVTIDPIQLKRDTDYTLSLKILSAGSQRTLYQPPQDAAAGTGILVTDADRNVLFHTAKIEALADLLSTNLYINPVTHVDTTPDIDLNFFAINESIVLTFGAPVPTGAVIDVQLRDENYNLIRTTNTTSATARTLTINPDVDLNPSAKYYLWVRMMDTIDGEYWVVPDASTVVKVDTYFTTNPPTTDGKSYIGFSTQADQKARLVSANLYLDGNVANYAEPFFRLDGTIELTFADIPAGTRISKAQLATAENQPSGLSVYARFDLSNPNKVLITPNAKLFNSSVVPYYYLQLELSKTVGAAEKVWSVQAASGQSGINGFIYVNVNTAHEIRFKTVSAFSVVNKGVGSSLTNIDLVHGTGNAVSDFDATGDIRIEFDRPIDIGTTARPVPFKAELRYYDGEYYDVTATAPTTTVTATAGGLSPDKTVLFIKPSNLLAPNKEFVVRLDVTSVDGQRIVYDSTNDGNPSDWTNYTNTASVSDLFIKTENSTLPRFIGISKQPVRSGTLVVAAGSLDAGAPANSNIVSRNNDAPDLTFTPASIRFGQNYNLYVRRNGIWEQSPNGSSNPINVGAGVTAPTMFTFDTSIPGGTPHVTAEGVQFRVRGINNAGFVAEAVVDITFR
jgi:hypothetical protein